MGFSEADKSVVVILTGCDDLTFNIVVVSIVLFWYPFKKMLLSQPIVLAKNTEWHIGRVHTNYCLKQ